MLFWMLSIRFRYSHSREITIWEKAKKILTTNISEIYEPIIFPKDPGRKLSIIYKEF